MDSTYEFASCPTETFARLAEVGSKCARERSMLEEELVEHYLPIAHRIASRYVNRGLDKDDLHQVACLALVKAIRRFDPAQGDFTHFAASTISGELKRYFRDSGWYIRPPRRIQELQGRIASTTWSTAPGTHEIDALAGLLGVRREDVSEAMDARGCFRPNSLDRPVGRGRMAVGETFGDDCHEYEFVEEWEAFRPMWDTLSDGDRQLLELRFFRDMTQTEIAKVMGVSQMQISRRLTSLLGRLRVEAA